MTTKSEMAWMVAHAGKIESFEHQWGHFNVTAIRAGILGGTIPFKAVTIRLTDNIRDAIKNLRDVDQDRVRELTRLGRLDDPVIFVHEPVEDMHDFIDGTHRIAGRIRKGKRTVRAFMIEMPDAIFMGPHRILADYGEVGFIDRLRKKT